MATTDMNAQIHIKDGNGNVNNIFPATKIANVEGLPLALNAKADTTTVTNQLSGKVDKETGKGLSTNDYTTAEKNKLSGIEAQANKTVISTSIPSTPTDSTVPSMKLVDETYAKNVNILGADLLDKAESWLFAHHITGGATPQGFCTFTHNSINIAACATNNNVEGVEGGITLYNLDTGALIRKITNNLFSHLNDITYYNGHIYITNGDDGVNDAILDLDLSDDTVTSKSIAAYTDEKVHGITWNGEYFYILTHTGAIFHLHKYNEALTQIISTVELWRGADFSATQGLFSYENYVFFIRGQNDRTKLKAFYNVMQAYSADTLQPIKTVYVPWGAELEGAGELNGEFYFYYNVVSKSGLIMKGTILNGEKTTGRNADALIGLGRFEKDVSIFIDETNTNFFLDLTYENPFTYWPEANIVMVNENTPRFNIRLLSDITQEMTLHPVTNAYIYVTGSDIEDGEIVNAVRTVSGSFAMANCNLAVMSYLNFTGDKSMEIRYCDGVVVQKCTLNRSGTPTFTRADKVSFQSTSFTQKIQINDISAVGISGEYTAINSCFDTNRLITGLRIDALPTNLSTWAPISGMSIVGFIYAANLEICKNLRGWNLKSADIKQLTNDDKVSDIHLCGTYNILADNTIADVPNDNGAILTLTKGQSDNTREYIWSAKNSSKRYIRRMNTGYDSGWLELNNDTHVSVSMFEKVGVIGDSFSSGETYTTGSSVDNYSVSWLQIMARMCGFTGTNYSEGGLTSATWLTDADHGLPALQANDPEDLCLIALGINDANRMTLGTAADIGTEANTFYGCYSKIINSVKTKNPSTRIICFTPARFGGDYDTFGEAIKEIADALNVPWVDITTHPFFKTGFYSSNQSHNHPTCMNYSAMASAYKELIERCMVKHPSYFNAYI